MIGEKLIAEIVSGGKDVVFVGTKRQAQKAVQRVSEKCGMHYVSTRWLGGMLTNFRTVRSRLQRLEQLEKMQQDGTLEKESKKQASRLKREMRKIKSNLEGVRNMLRLPGVVVVVDVRKEHLALAEAKKLGIATIGILDTDSNPDVVDVAIPANDDSIRVIDILLGELAKAVSIGKTMVTAKTPPAGPKQRVARSRKPTLARASADVSKEAVAAVKQSETQIEAKPPKKQEKHEPVEQSVVEKIQADEPAAEQS